MRKWLNIGVFGLVSGTYLGLVVNSRFWSLAMLGAMILYYVLVYAVDDAERRGDSGSIFRRFGPIAYFPIFFLVLVLLMFWTHYPVARLIGSNVAPGYAESQSLVEEYSCTTSDFGAQGTYCTTILVEESTFYSTSAFWESALNNWMLMASVPVSGIFIAVGLMRLVKRRRTLQAER